MSAHCQANRQQGILAMDEDFIMIKTAVLGDDGIHIIDVNGKYHFINYTDDPEEYI